MKPAERREARRVLVIARAAVVLTILGGVVAGDALAVPDDVIEDKAARRMRRSTILRRLPIEISVTGGRVAVSGETETLAQAWTVREKLTSIHGVLALDDGLTVRRSDLADAEIEEAVGARLRRGRRIRKSGMEAAVEDGVVTLSGTVRYGPVRTRAARLVSTVPGVVEIVDRIETPASTDDKIYKTLRRMFGESPRIRVGGRVLPSVSGGIVTLEGFVPKLYQKYLAESATREVQGVREVINKLVVQP